MMRRKHKSSSHKKLLDRDLPEPPPNNTWLSGTLKGLIVAAGLSSLLAAGVFLVLPDYGRPRNDDDSTALPEGGSQQQQQVESAVSCRLLIERASATFERFPTPTPEWETALDLLASCVIQEPENPSPKWMLAVALMRMARVDEALAFLDEAVGSGGQHAGYLKSGGVLLASLGYHPEAVRCFEAFLELSLRVESWPHLLASIAHQRSDEWSFLYDDAGEDVASILEVLLHSYLQTTALEKAGYLYKVVIGFKGPERCPELVQAYSSFAFGLGDVSSGIKYLRTYNELQYIAKGYGGADEAYEVITAHSLRLLMAGVESHIIVTAKNLLQSGRAVWDELVYNCDLKEEDAIEFETVVRLSQVRAVYIKCVLACKMIEQLVDEGAVAYSENRFGWTPYHHAAALGDPQLLQELLNLHVDSHSRTTLGHTPLHVVAMKGTYQAVPALLRGGVNPDERDYFNRTALDIACLHRWTITGLAQALQLQPQPHSCPPGLSYVPPPPHVMQGGWLGSGPTLPPTLSGEHCDFDVINSSNVTDLLFNYLSLQRPVLVRNASNSHEMKDLYHHWQRNKMEMEHGNMQLHRLRKSNVEVGRDVKHNRATVTLKSYLVEMRKVFQDQKGYDTIQNIPAPEFVFEKLNNSSPLLAHFVLPFVLNPNLTHILPTHTYLYLGPSLSGENIYFHKNSWSLLIYGLRRLFLFPPSASFYSRDHILNWWKNHKRSSEILECVQYPGDLLVMPDMWAMGAVNLRESIGLKSEFVYGSSEFSI